MKILGIMTGSRAEWGLLKPLAHKLIGRYFVPAIVTGQHTSYQFGGTSSSVLEDMTIGTIVPCVIDSDEPEAMGQSLGLCIMNMSSTLAKMRLHGLIILGDRYEAVGTALAAHILRIPIIHIEGGEDTTGSLDNGYRDCISSLASVHLVAHEEAARRLERMGCTNVYITGSLGAVIPVLKKPSKIYKYVVSLHSSFDEACDILEVIMNIIGKGNNILFVGSNCDAGGRAINSWVNARTDWTVKFNLPREEYLAYVKYAECLIGNSSSGIIEAPSLQTPTINIGTRQNGRLSASSIFSCKSIKEIKQALKSIKKIDWTKVSNFYTKPDTLIQMMKIIKKHF